MEFIPGAPGVKIVLELFVAPVSLRICFRVFAHEARARRFDYFII